MQTTLINPRARYSPELRHFCQKYKQSPPTFLSTNPKTEKSKVQTYILHLAPADTSGVNVCAGAGNCKKICLHFAGNPVYMNGKGACRIRKTLAYDANPQAFMELLVVSILTKRFKLDLAEVMAIRLNGTSDIAWESVDFNVSVEFARFCAIKFGITLHVGLQNIFELFNSLDLQIKFYDYTKIKRNWAYCAMLGYHLTFSYDGADNASNLKICRDALVNGVNVAAAFNVRKRDELPLYVKASQIYGSDPAYSDRIIAIQDGDLTDYRPGDVPGGSIVGLRFKLPHGIAYSAAERDAFCMAWE
jgi:hypothetical protein